MTSKSRCLLRRELLTYIRICLSIESRRRGAHSSGYEREACVFGGAYVQLMANETKLGSLMKASGGKGSSRLTPLPHIGSEKRRS
jgi:hypothetical protein